VWEHNTAAIAFYQRYGFIKTGTHPFTLGSDVQTDWIMQLNLLAETNQ
jgi:ribosomal protein S18 acetylase RimI-like enzyme